MADQFTIKCIECKKERLVGRSMVYLIKIGKCTGKCVSCCSKGNTNSQKGEIYDSKLYGTSIYKVWINLTTRCNNKNTPDFVRYGGRGIRVCTEWNSFSGFLKDMGSSYKLGLTLDRINNDGNYCKENCRWTTKKEQANNRRTSRYLKHQGEIKTLAQWSDLLGIKRTTISERIDSLGWSVSQALTLKSYGR